RWLSLPHPRHRCSPQPSQTLRKARKPSKRSRSATCRPVYGLPVFDKPVKRTRTVLTVLDVNNFWSPTGGGVRRYELEKARVLGALTDENFMYVLPDRTSWTERRSRSVVFEHIGDTLPSPGEYRNIVLSGELRRVIERHRPDVIECG